MIILGLIILLAAVVIGVVGVVNNSGSAHALNSDFSVFGYQADGSTGMLFLWGIVLGAIGMFGLGMLLTGVRRNSLQARHARHELRQTRRETTAAPGGEVQQPLATPVQTQPSAQTQTRVQPQRNWRHPFGGPTAGPTVAPH